MTKAKALLSASLCSQGPLPFEDSPHYSADANVTAGRPEPESVPAHHMTPQPSILEKGLEGKEAGGKPAGKRSCSSAQREGEASAMH